LLIKREPCAAFAPDGDDPPNCLEPMEAAGAHVLPSLGYAALNAP